MLDDHHRVVAPQGGVEQAHVVEGRARRDDAPSGGGGEDPGGVHRVLGAVPGAGADLAAQHERYRVVAAEHVPRLADLVEELVGGHPEEVGVHELDDRPVAQIERHAPGEAREGVLADRRAEHPVGVGVREALGRAVGPAPEAMDVLTHHDDGGVGGHAPCHHLRDDVDELALGHGPGEGVRLLVADAGAELREVASHSDVAEGGLRPFLRPDAALPGLAGGVGFEKAVADASHRGVGPLGGPLDLVGAQDATAREALGHQRDGVALPPPLLLLLGAVPEGAAREGAVLVEVPVKVGLDDRRAVAGAHVRQGLLRGQVDRERVHAVHAPARDGEAEAAYREARLGGHLADVRGHRVLVVLDEEAHRERPGGGQVERLQDGTDVRRPVAEVGDRHGVGAGVAVRPGEPGGLRNAAADDGVGPHGAGLAPLKVHRAATAPAETT